MLREIGIGVRAAAAWFALGLLLTTFVSGLLSLPSELRLARALAVMCSPQVPR